MLIAVIAVIPEPMGGGQTRGSPEAVRFNRRLSELKRNGCNVLLVGTDGLDACCERFLGESAAEPRRRLFVAADAAPAAARRRAATDRSSGPDAERTAVVDWRADGVGGRVETTADGPRSGPDRSDRDVTVESGDLRELGVAVTDTVEAFDAEADPLGPAELRVCFDSLAPLVDGYADRDARRFLLGVTEAVERVDGMGHYHLPAEYGSEAVEPVSPLFDAAVEVRREGGAVEQRWHVEDITTDWLSL